MQQRSFSCAQHRSTTVTLLANRSGLHGFTWLPQNYRRCLTAMSSISQACCASLFRSVQIKSSPDETNPKDVLLGLPWGKPSNPVTRSLAMRLHTPQLAPKNLPRAAINLESQIRLWSHAPLYQTCGLPIYKTQEVRLWISLTHAPPRFLASPPRASRHSRSINALKNPC